MQHELNEDLIKSVIHELGKTGPDPNLFRTLIASPAFRLWVMVGIERPYHYMLWPFHDAVVVHASAVYFGMALQRRLAEVKA